MNRAFLYTVVEVVEFFLANGRVHGSQGRETIKFRPQVGAHVLFRVAPYVL